jgi:hypothetical protein
MLRVGRIQGEGLIVSKQTWTPPIGASGTTKIIKNKIELKKLWPPKIEKIKNSKKQTIEHYKGWFLNTQKNSSYVTLFLLVFKNYL